MIPLLVTVFLVIVLLPIVYLLRLKNKIEFPSAEFLRFRKVYIILIGVLFTVSLLLPSFLMFRPNATEAVGGSIWLKLMSDFFELFLPKDYIGIMGLKVFLAGWLGPTLNIYAWYANPFGAFAFLMSLKGRYWYGILSSAIAIVLGLQSIFYLDLRGFESIHQVDNVGIGFYVWESCFVVILIYCYISLRITQSKKKQ